MTLPVVLVTGGAKRIGSAICRAFAAAGWHVVIHYGSSRDEAERLAASLPSAGIAQAELNNWDGGVAMIETVAREHHDFRLLINNASVFRHDLVRGLDPACFDEAMQVNAGSAARMAQAFFAHARTGNERTVIHMLDQKLDNPNPDFFSYTMSKHALAATVPMLAMAPQRKGDRIYGLCPGAILPSHDQSPDEAERSHRLNLLGRLTGPDEVADAALFLSRGALESGSLLFVDSGQHLLNQPRDVIYLEREGAGA